MSTKNNHEPASGHNATGIVLHTNLGREKLSDAAVKAIQSVAQDYNTLEYNLEKGSRRQPLCSC